MKHMAWLAAVLAPALALAAHAEIYKWVDEKGHTQYGQVPPAGVEAKRMSVSGNGGAPDAVSADKAKEDAPRASAHEAAKPLEPKARAERCKFERDQLAVLEAGDVTYRDEKGLRHILAPEKRAAALKQVQENVKRYCP